jgi:hypothetical protein
MQECETGTGKGSLAKRVTVRSGGAGHAHSGVVKANVFNNPIPPVAKAAKGKIVMLGR